MVNTPLFNPKDQFTLRVNKELSIQLDAIVEKLQTIAERFSIEQDKEKSAFRNVLNVAMDSSASLEVIKNFIRYQVGRQGASKIWKNNPAFANALVQQINELSSDVETILTRIKQECGKEHPVGQYIADNQHSIERSLHLQVAQLYLGYLSREHTARLGASLQENNSDREQSQESQRNNLPTQKPVRKN